VPKQEISDGLFFTMVQTADAEQLPLPFHSQGGQVPS